MVLASGRGLVRLGRPPLLRAVSARLFLCDLSLSGPGSVVGDVGPAAVCEAVPGALASARQVLGGARSCHGGDREGVEHVDVLRL